MTSAFAIRVADPDRDAAACASIYAPYVTDSLVSFEEVAPTPAEIARRMAGAHAWLVAVEDDGTVIGYAYASKHRERAAYRWAADVAVYVSTERQRGGVGRALYEQLIEVIRALGIWQLCAGISQPNPASDGLHAAVGFVEVGVYRKIGYKAGAWHDVRWWQLDLRPGDVSAPDRVDLEP